MPEESQIERTARSRILVVDDDPIMLRAVSQPLLHKGYEVVPVEGGDDAVDWLADHTPDLIILDVVMPGLSGFDVCRIVREAAATRKTPVIFLTARRGRDDMDEARQAGSDLFLTKPVMPSRLVNMVEMFLSTESRLTRRVGAFD